MTGKVQNISLISLIHCFSYKKMTSLSRDACIFVDRYPPPFLLRAFCPWYLSLEKRPFQGHRFHLFGQSFRWTTRSSLRTLLLLAVDGCGGFLRVIGSRLPNYTVSRARLTCIRTSDLITHQTVGKTLENVVDSWAQLIVSTEGDFHQLNKFLIVLLSVKCVRNTNTALPQLCRHFAQWKVADFLATNVWRKSFHMVGLRKFRSMKCHTKTSVVIKHPLNRYYSLISSLIIPFNVTK
jgi:hypothetical protein